MANRSVTVNGITFPNPVLTAAGPNVRSGALMCAAVAGGAGGVVAKTVSVNPAQDARPTIRRVDPRGLINSETWSEVPVERYLEDLQQVKETGRPLIASVGYRPAEVAALGRLLEAEVAPDAIEFSTHYTGTSHEPLIEVARALRSAVSCPIWMKLSPAVMGLEELARAASAYVDAFVAINSYGPVLDFDIENPVPRLGSEWGAGWMSGAPIRPIALGIVYRLVQAQPKPVIGVGGVETGDDAIKFIMAGAAAVQVCTAAIRYGNGIYGKIDAEIDRRLEGLGRRSVEEVRGLYRPDPERPKTIDAVMRVDAARCTGCKGCLRQCIHGAIAFNAGTERAYIVEERCIGCGYCHDVCRFDAMHLIPTDVHGVER